MVLDPFCAADAAADDSFFGEQLSKFFECDELMVVSLAFACGGADMDTGTNTTRAIVAVGALTKQDLVIIVVPCRRFAWCYKQVHSELAFASIN